MLNKQKRLHTTRTFIYQIQNILKKYQNPTTFNKMEMCFHFISFACCAFNLCVCVDLYMKPK